MIKKVATVCICVFLSIVLIGAVVFPDYSFRGVVSNLMRATAPVTDALYSLSSIVNKFLYGNETPLTYEQQEFVNSTRNDVNSFVEKLNEFIPYHLSRYDLIDRSSNQSIFNIFTFKVNDLHSDHKICVCKCTILDAHKAFDFFDAMLGYTYVIYDIFYCGVCQKVMGISGGGTDVIYPEDLPDQLYIGSHYYCNDFTFNEFLDYFS